MSIEVLLVQFLVLAFTGAVWWLARRDLGSRPAPPVPAAASADARELEQLCVMLEVLVTDLAARMEAVEQKLQENGGAGALPAVSLPASTPAPAPAPAILLLPSAPAPSPMPSFAASTLLPSFPAPPPDPATPEPEIAAHAPLYALLEAGITDPAEIARRTGLGRGEVDLILSLRARRSL